MKQNEIASQFFSLLTVLTLLTQQCHHTLKSCCSSLQSYSVEGPVAEISKDVWDLGPVKSESTAKKCSETVLSCHL